MFNVDGEKVEPREFIQKHAEVKDLYHGREDLGLRC